MFFRTLPRERVGKSWGAIGLQGSRKTPARIPQDSRKDPARANKNPTRASKDPARIQQGPEGSNRDPARARRFAIGPLVFRPWPYITLYSPRILNKWHRRKIHFFVYFFVDANCSFPSAFTLLCGVGGGSLAARLQNDGVYQEANSGLARPHNPTDP